MRVLHVAPSFARRDGGPSEVLRGLLPALSDRGISWTLVATDKGATPDDDDLRLDERTTAVRSRLLPRWTFAWGLRRPLRQAIVDSDIVHIHSVHTFPSSMAMSLARRHRKPYVLEPHGALDTYHLGKGAAMKRLYSRLIDRRGLRHLSAAVYSSTMEMNQGKQFLPTVPSYVMPLGVAQDLFDVPLAKNREPARILFLGRVTEKKRLDLVLKALSTPKLRSSNVKLVVAGPLDPRLEYDPSTLARELGVEPRVEFLGQVDSNTRSHLLSTSAAFVLPSEDESFGMAVAEALAAGCPVICSDHIGIAKRAADEGALVISELSESGLAGAIEAVLSDPHSSAEMAMRGRRYAHANFTWAIAAERISIAYDEVLAARAVGA
ncbi:MAG: glycosyltransferase [Glaciihabitans sp.]